MIENLFTNPKLFTECKNNRVSRFCGRFRADRYALKTRFSLYKIGEENATFWPKGEIPSNSLFSLFFPFFEEISHYKMATGQNFKKVADNFLETLIRIMLAKI